MANLAKLMATWRKDPVTFMESLVDPETGKRFELYAEQKAFVRRAFTLTEDGRLPYPEVVFSAPKKSGKTALAAMCNLYVTLVLGGRFAEGYAVANDLEQAQGRVFKAIVRILEATPMFAGEFKATGSAVTFPNGATITALAADYAGAAGGNPNITVFDELWAYVSERFTRLWDEMIPPPTRQVACRLTCTYAGFEGESKLLEDMYHRGLKGTVLAPDLYEIPGRLLMYWTHDLKAPWQTEAWRAQMEENSRPLAYLRHVKNQFVSSESPFLPVEWWDRAATSNPVVMDKTLQVVLGVDAATKRDSLAVVATAFNPDTKKVRLVAHRIFYPKPGEPLDLEETAEETVREFAARFSIVECRYDPMQMVRSAQTLTKEGVRMVEFVQSVPNLTTMSVNLYELLKGGNLEAYPDDEIRLAIQRAVAVESSRGMKIAKEKQSHKIDCVVALAMSALGAVQTPQKPDYSGLELDLSFGRRESPWVV